MSSREEFMAWAVKMDTTNLLDGRRVYFLGAYNIGCESGLRGCRKMLFETREAARQYIRAEYGYLATRPDLRREPHCWRAPKPVRVTVTIHET